MNSAPIPQDPANERHMGAALALGRRGLGIVWPNPAVGCILVQHSDNGERIVGRGWTRPGGRPHAETEALRRAGTAAKGATAYVTLEPCNHHGKAPPCTEALIAAGVARVVAAIEDPDPRVAGKGHARLREAGIEVVTDVCADAAAEDNAGYLMHRREGRPLITLKTATTLDGRIAAHTGESKWITAEAARRRAHLMRATHDAVVVGIGTALVDDPTLTCRLPGLEDRSPVRIVVDARMQLPLTARLAKTAKQWATWMIVLEGADKDRRKAYEECGIEVLEVAAGKDGYPDSRKALAALAGKGLTRIMVEGGSALAASLIRADLVDRIAWFRTGGIMGGDGIPAIAPYGVDHLEEMLRFQRVTAESLGDDVLETYRRRD